ncbi:enoyl-CoA hydratase/isomerase family protein [Microbacterium sp. NPDC055910]|uniref:enoyl-CoA hydratase/isomerase family protein n=1 Tax=Microbacterium sp. NPDC055910 TaxID=3345659 RepID=UPI0035DF3001
MISPDTDSIAVRREGPVTVLRFTRPDSLNALSFGMLRHFHDILDDLLYDYEQRVVVLEAEGRAFCAGIDLYDVTGGQQWVEGVGRVQATYGLQEAVGRLITKLRRIPQPVIAVVNGLAVGGGLSIACAADVRIGEPAARFNPAFVKLAASGGDMGSSWLLPRIIGFEAAAAILLTGRNIDADEALRLGLLTSVVEAGAGTAAALALAEEMCALAPFTTRMTKSLLNLSRDGASLDQMIEYENRTQVMMTSTADFTEATTAFVERRTPSFGDA